jgi:ketosteroid isomerase-like protein
MAGIDALAGQEAHAALARWSDAFAKMDAGSMASLYAIDALFYGSTPELYPDQDVIRAYFGGLPPFASRRVAFRDVVARKPGPDLLNLAGLAIFTFNEAVEFTFRLTQTLMREGDGWKIISHHASLSPTPIKSVTQ